MGTPPLAQQLRGTRVTKGLEGRIHPQLGFKLQLLPLLIADTDPGEGEEGKHHIKAGVGGKKTRAGPLAAQRAALDLGQPCIRSPDTQAASQTCTQQPGTQALWHSSAAAGKCLATLFKCMKGGFIWIQEFPWGIRSSTALPEPSALSGQSPSN